ncbi:sigma-70 family RNA polymerase sigma factor [Chitinophaga vietnamensis]|uniref:sigma-70 family RNA polymerase sigma factor n=1 Tax=Chitinophaga vietnamensis TaxID=2593957 RepID=UPI0011781E8B|nr:sigma-70 family RNA polymerase sigma factor [Chitinophaga vietnamensis]
MPEERLVTVQPSAWVQRYADDLYRFALSRTGDNALAQDLVQETFLAALQAQAQFKGESSEKSWLTAILKNKIIDHYRKSRRSGITVSIDEEHTGDSDPHHFFFDEKGHWRKNMAPQPWAPMSHSPQEQHEFYRILHACIRKLKGLGQAVFNLKHLEEKKSEEICKDLSISASNYWVLMHRAKLQMRACLDKNWFSN